MPVTKLQMKAIRNRLKGHNARIKQLIAGGNIDLGMGINRGVDEIPRANVEHTLRTWFPQHLFRRLYRECEHSLQTNFKELVDAIMLYQLVYLRSPNRAWRTNAKVCGQCGTRAGQHEESVLEFIAGKLIMMAITGWETSQFVAEQPDMLYEIYDDDHDLLDCVVLPALSFFEAYFPQNRFVIAADILQLNITSYERHIKGRAEHGVWSNDWIKLPVVKNYTANECRKAGSGIFLPYAAMLATIVTGFLDIMERAAVSNNLQFVPLRQRITAGTMVALRRGVICLRG